VPDPSLGLPNGGAFKPTRAKYIPTIMDRLDAAGLSWKIYSATKGEGAYGLFGGKQPGLEQHGCLCHLR